MSTSNQLKLGRGATFVALAALLFFAVQAPLAAKDYKAKDLKGTYHYIVSEIRVQAPDIEYCSQHGTIAFDGSGFAEIVTSVRKCTRHPAGTTELTTDEMGEFNYEVFANGEVLLIELDDLGNETDYVTHGRILQKGNLLLFDDTASFPAHPDFLMTAAVAAKE